MREINYFNKKNIKKHFKNMNKLSKQIGIILLFILIKLRVYTIFKNIKKLLKSANRLKKLIKNGSRPISEKDNLMKHLKSMEKLEPLIGKPFKLSLLINYLKIYLKNVKFLVKSKLKN